MIAVAWLAALALQAPVLPEITAPELVQRFVADACAWIDEKPDADVEKLRATFDATMRGLLPKEAIESTLAVARDSGDARATLVDAKATDTHRSWTYLLEQEHTRWLTTVTLDREERVSGWWLRLAPFPRARTELLERTLALDGDVRLCVDLLGADGKRLERVETGRGQEFLPLGSIFKLYVLAELARSVAAGERSLDDELVIEDAKKSLPSGEMQNLAAGTKVELRDAAREMIRISDNTATDHLLFLLGRERVESGLAQCFHSAPERLKPFLSTLEMFAIKSLKKTDYERIFGVAKLDEVATRWRDATLEERRAWLAEVDRVIADTAPQKNPSGTGMRYALLSRGAKKHVEIEWLARASDVCDLVAAAQRGELHSPDASRVFLEFYAAGNSLYAMPGVVAHGYKGGSETGVFALSTRVTFVDGRSVVACLLRSGFDADDTKVPDQTIGLFVDWIENLRDGDAVGKARAKLDAAGAGGKTNGDDASQ